jgi:hypothetical protein
MGMETENKGLIDVRDCPCDGCQAKPCGHPAKCVKFTLWLNKTVDAVPVVRCKDCKYYEHPEYYGGGTKDVCRTFKRQTQENAFCSYGEKRADK